MYYKYVYVHVCVSKIMLTVYANVHRPANDVWSINCRPKCLAINIFPGRKSPCFMTSLLYSAAGNYTYNVQQSKEQKIYFTRANKEQKLDFYNDNVAGAKIWNYVSKNKKNLENKSSLHFPFLFNPILLTWFRDSCFTCDGSSTIQVFPLLFNMRMVI